MKSTVVKALGILLLLSGMGLGVRSVVEETRGPSPNPTARAQTVAESFGKLPLSFERNHGQADAAVDFIAHGPGYSLALLPEKLLLAIGGPLSGHSSASSIGRVIGLKLVGTDAHPHATGVDALREKVNYLIGDDPATWHTNIPTFGGVRYHDVYPGIDQLFYGNRAGRLEYDFVVAPGTDSDVITLGISGARELAFNRSGDIVLDVGHGRIVQRKPLAYQEVEGQRTQVPARYVLRGNQIAFDIGSYDPSRELFIDPVLEYSTYLGDSNTAETRGTESGEGIVVDSAGNAYITGLTNSPTFPMTPGAFDSTKGGFTDAFVTKLNPMGSGLVYSTYLGGTDSPTGEIAGGIAIDASGNAYVTGITGSDDFPTTPGAFQPTARGNEDGFVTKLNAGGSALVYSTYLGGASNLDSGTDLILDSSGNAYVSGFTDSADFPTTPGAFQTVCDGGDVSCSDAFVTKLNAAGSALLYSTFLGGTANENGSDIDLDSTGNAYVVGTTDSVNFPTANPFQATCTGCQFLRSDAFVTKLNPAGSALVYSTYLGGSLDDFGRGIDADSSGSAYVTGETESSNFDVTPGAFDTTSNGIPDAFVTKFNPGGSTLAYSTYLGGSVNDEANAVKVDASGNAHVIGSTKSSNFPTLNPVQAVCGCTGSFDAFVTKLNASGSALVYSTFLGGISLDEGHDVALDSSASAYVTGQTYAADFRTTPGSLKPTNPDSDGDAFVTKISDGGEGGTQCTITGTDGSDNLAGTSGNDVICGLGGKDTINGGAGNDTILGGAGNDTILGEAGNDTLNGEAGTDTASYAAAPAAVSADLAVGTATGGDGSDTLSGIERLTGSSFNDTLKGTTGVNALSGGPGDDTLSGNDGNDTINGSSGNDSLDGGAGTDRLDGGTGTDTCTAGETVTNCEQ